MSEDKYTSGSYSICRFAIRMRAYNITNHNTPLILASTHTCTLTYTDKLYNEKYHALASK